MSESHQHGNKSNSEYVLGSLNDDYSDDSEEDDEPEYDQESKEYEDKMLQEISAMKAEVQRIFENLLERPEEQSSYQKHEEHLLQLIIKLDNIDPKNNDKIREARKSSIVYTQECLQQLDNKLKSVSSDGEK